MSEAAAVRETAAADEIAAAPQALCPFCASAGGFLYRDLTDRLFAAPGNWNLRRCSNRKCDLVWMDPLPRPSEIAKAYRQYYTHEDKDDYALTGGDATGLAKRAYAGTYRLVRRVLGVERDRAEIAVMFQPAGRQGRLLDVGCGGGGFLKSMQALGWDVAGSDFDAKAVEHARSKEGLDVRLGGSEQFADRAGTFDLITMSHVIEHVYEPWAFLDEWGTLLAPEGEMILRTPNSRSLGARLFGRYWRGLEPPRHLQIFSKRALRACADKTQLQLERVWTTAAGSETIWVASTGLWMSRGQPGLFRVSRGDVLIAKLAGPLYTVVSKIAAILDPYSGDEICASFRRRA